MIWVIKCRSGFSCDLIKRFSPQMNTSVSVITTDSCPSPFRPGKACLKSLHATLSCMLLVGMTMVFLVIGDNFFQVQTVLHFYI